MTVAAVLTQTVYALAGTTLGPFNTVWPYAAPGDVTCQVDYGAGDGPQLLVQGVDYLLTANNPTLSNGGSVTLAAYILSNFAAAWGPNAEIILARLTPRAQPSSFGEAVGFSPQASEQALDNVERQVQELTTQMGRTLQVGYGETPPDIEPVPSALWGLDAGGDFLNFEYGDEPGQLIGTDVAGALTFYPVKLPIGFTPPGLIGGSGAQFFPWAIFPVRTSLGAFNGNLPQLSSVPPGAWLIVLDVDNNAGANNYTVNAFAGDHIADHGVLDVSAVLSTSNIIALFLANVGSWTVIYYGR